MNRQRLIAVIMVCLLVLSVGYSFLKMPRQKKVDKLTNTPGTTAAGPKRDAAQGPDTRVRLDLLQNNQGGFSGFKRNLFTPVFRDLSKLPPAKPVIPPPPPPPPPPPLPPPPPTISPMEQALSQFTFMGFLEKDQKKTIFLSQGKDIYLVKKGDKIANRYEAVNITNDALTIKMSGSETEVIIPLIEEKTLKPAPSRQVRPQPRPSQPGAGNPLP